MFKKNLLTLIVITCLVSSCGETLDNVKRGLTGAKAKTSDEFLVQKKDPLILPPDYDSLPSPLEKEEAKKEISIFENTLTKDTSSDSNSNTDSTEQSILKKIRDN